MAPVVELLCEGGSDVNAYDTLMRSEACTHNHAQLHTHTHTLTITAPLHLASWVGSADCVRVLLEYKSKLNAVNKVGRTPLHVAACFGRTEVGALGL